MQTNQSYTPRPTTFSNCPAPSQHFLCLNYHRARTRPLAAAPTAQSLLKLFKLPNPNPFTLTRLENPIKALSHVFALFLPPVPWCFLVALPGAVYSLLLETVTNYFLNGPSPDLLASSYMNKTKILVHFRTP